MDWFTALFIGGLSVAFVYLLDKADKYSSLKKRLKRLNDRTNLLDYLYKKVDLNDKRDVTIDIDPVDSVLSGVSLQDDIIIEFFDDLFSLNFCIVIDT